MNPVPRTTGAEVDDEISSLVSELLEKEMRLHELTGGEVDTVLDPTGRAYMLRRAQEQVRHNEALLRMAGHMARFGGWAVDLPGTRVTWSDEVCEIHDVPPGTSPSVEEAIEFYAPEWRGAMNDAFGRCVQVGQPFSLELQIISARKHRLWVRCVGEPVYDAKGKIYRVQGAFQDINERKLEEERLTESENRVRNILDSMFAFVAVVSPEGLLVDVNRAPLDAAGVRREDVIGKPFADSPWLSHSKETSQQVRRAVARSLSGETVREDFTVQLHDGVAIMDASFGPLFDARGRVQQVIASAVDVTARVKAIADRGESELRFRQVVENMREVFWIFDLAQRRLLYVSPGYDLIWGRERDDVLVSTKAWVDTIHPDDRQRILDAQAKQVLGTYDEVYRILQPEGALRWIRDRAFPVKDSEGVVYRIVGVAEDITYRKAAEEALQEQARLLNLAPDAIIVREFDGRILLWNHGAEIIYGWTAEQAIGRLATDLLGIDPEVSAQAMAHTTEMGEWNGEGRQNRMDGTEVTVNSRWSLMRDDAGEPDSILVINRDVTEQRKLEGLLLRAQRVESLGTLASGVAHDLNNILAPIMMAAEVMRDSPTPDLLASLADIIGKSAQRGSDIVGQMLSFGRGTEGDRGPLQLAETIRELERVTLQTFPKDIVIQTRLAPELSLILAEPTHVHQVLLNLFVNARDAMPNGGTLKISAENFAVDESFASTIPDARAGDFVRFTVSDTGSGIPAAVLEKIFDPFFTTKEIGKGTGLGLSTVAGIVKSHGGFLTVHSGVGRGTTFVIYFPVVVDEKSAAPPRRETAGPRGRGEWILVVDDESALRTIAQTVLVAHGYKVLLAGDGAEAVAVYAQNAEKIRVVVTDIMMPVMDGVALSRALCRLNPAVRIIASTGKGHASRREEIKNFGVAGFLDKPYSAATLLNSIQAVLERDLPPLPSPAGAKG